MEPTEIIDSIIAFAEGSPIIAGAVALLFVYLIYRKTKFTLGILFLALLLYGVFYMITSLASTGTSQKGKIIQEKKSPSE